MASTIITKRVITNIYCAHCRKRKAIPRGRKLTPKEREEIEAWNNEHTLICRTITINGKLDEMTGELPYYFERQPHHYECLLAWLRRKFKKDEEKVQIEINLSIERREKKIEDSRKKGILKKDEMSTAKETRQGRERLENYLMGHYGASVLSKKLIKSIKDLNEGKHKDYSGLVISYEKLLEMFMFYEDDLMGIYMNKVKKGNAPPNANQRILYDLAVVVLNIDEYNSKQEKKWYMQQDERTEGEILDARKYIRPIEDNGEDEERQKEIERASRFAEEQTKEYDEEDDSYIASLFKDD